MPTDAVVHLADPDRIMAAHLFAERAHEGQVYVDHDGGPGEPYIRHPVRVARSVPPSYRVVALLHDCLEDAGTLPAWIEPVEREALDHLTRDKKNETYEAYIARIRWAEGTSGAIARSVKRADLADNLAHRPPAHLRARYRDALRVLED